MASTLFSFITPRPCLHIAAVVWCVGLWLPAMTALPMKDIIGKAVITAKQQQQQHRHKRAIGKTDCAQPSDLEDMFQRLNNGLNNGTHFLRPAPNGQAITTTTTGLEGAKFVGGPDSHSDPNESTDCPSVLTRVGTAPLEHRSLCPYFFDTLQLPHGYYPSTLQWAKCKCQQCVENNVYGCEAVTRPVAVLKPVGCLQGMQRYEEHVLQVHVACACAFKGSRVESLSFLDGPASTTTTAAAAAPSWGVN